MKRFLCCFTLLVSLLSIWGCNSPNFDPVLFYYCRKPEEYQYFESNGVICYEGRDLTGHSKDLHYLVALYLAGPLDEELVCPFPQKTQLIDAAATNRSVQITLSDLGSSMTDSEFSLAAACLAKTCIPFSDVKEATIRSGARTITINSTNLILFDESIVKSAKGE